METALTKQIKRGLPYFRLDMPTKMRTPRFAEEVWTPSGIVDLIRFEDCKDGYREQCALIDYQEYDEKYREFMRNSAGQLGLCKVPGQTFPNSACHNCLYHKKLYGVGMRITCFEVKITVEDFHSSNGHNFHGHYNYYVVPKDMVPKIVDEVPDEIGLIAYYAASDSYRMVKECTPREVSEALQIQLLYNAMKKWVDKFQTQYFD